MSTNEATVSAIEWNMDKFKNNIDSFEMNHILGKKIEKISSENAIIDFYNSAFPIDRLCYTITARSKDGNTKNVKGYISMTDFIALEKELELIIEMDKYYKTNKNPAFNSSIDKKGFFEYQGKCNSKDSDNVYSRIFKIMPSRLNNNILIVVQNALAVVDPNGGIQPTGNRENLCIPVEYKTLRGVIGKIIKHYDSYMNLVYQGKAKMIYKD